MLATTVFADPTCVQYNYCVRPDGEDPETTPCPDARETHNPVLYNWDNKTGFGEPKVLTSRS